MQRCALLALVMLDACVARPPSSAEDAGVVDAGIDIENATAGEPFGRCRITVECRLGVCTEGRCLPPVLTFPDPEACAGNRFNTRSTASPDPFLDCGAWGAICIPRRGCALPPGARCAVDGRPLLPCGAGDVCLDGLCVVDDVGGRIDATPLSIPGSAIFTIDAPDDLDCFVVDRVSFGDVDVESTASFFGNNNLDPDTGELQGLVMCRFGPIGQHAIATAPRENLEGCVDDYTVADILGGTRTCPAQSVCRPRLSTGFDCVPVLGEPCAQAERCAGYCLRSSDECVALPSPLPPVERCARLDDGTLHYRTGPIGGHLCADRCIDGIGCIDATPTSTCSMWRDDPAGGLAPCVTAEVPAWPDDDYPGHYAEAPLIAPGTHTVTSTQAGDIDCVTVVAPVRGVLDASTSSGRMVTRDATADVGEHVRVCVEGHEGAATLQIDITEGP